MANETDLVIFTGRHGPGGKGELWCKVQHTTTFGVMVKVDADTHVSKSREILFPAHVIRRIEYNMCKSALVRKKDA